MKDLKTLQRLDEFSKMKDLQTLQILDYQSLLIQQNERLADPAKVRLSAVTNSAM
jgi:hypothetical protein